jgi:hypothetical protein
MQVLAKALILAVQHLADRDSDATEDQDVEMLERLSALLQQATPEEYAALIAASNDLRLHDWPEQIGLQGD